jgi:CubicO group peptidase (beta-lactamase class C family)
MRVGVGPLSNAGSRHKIDIRNASLCEPKERGSSVRASIIVAAVTFALALSPVQSQTSFGSETTDCGAPSDIHDGWELSSQEKQGIASLPLCAMTDGIVSGKLANVDAIVVVRHGVLVYEKYFSYPSASRFEATTRHLGNSMTKSVVSLLIGIGVDRGWIKDLDDQVASYFPDNPDLQMSPTITLRHLLTMSAALGSSGPPGVSFEYNDDETELLGAILQKTSGKPVDVLARETIFSPLGINDVEWETSPSSGVAMSSRGLNLRPRDWAKIGQLVLNRGAWEGKQIVPADWIAQSTTEQIKTNGLNSVERVRVNGPASYGYLWWLGRSPEKERTIQWIAAIGFDSQKTMIIPGLDMVVVFNASRQSKNMVAPELDLLNGYILPAAADN